MFEDGSMLKKLAAGWLLLLLSACGGGSSDEAPFPSTAAALATIEGRKTVLDGAAAARADSLSELDTLRYIASYPDLIEAFGTDLALGRLHHALYAESEHRQITFVPLRYIASHADLMEAFGANDSAGVLHYILHGYAEGRKLTFDALRYAASYDDLAVAFGIDQREAARHYILFGRAELRKITFDPLQYIASYPDLMKAFGIDEVAATQHYLLFGRAERRRAGFYAESYLNQYADLIAAFGTDLAAATRHYILHGYAENRQTLQPIARIVMPREPALVVGELVNVQGEGGRADSNGSGFSWRLVTRPAGSTTVLANASAPIVGFSPDVSGTYVLDLTIVAGKYTNNMFVSLVAGNPVGGVLTGSTTWTLQGGPYVLTAPLKVAAGAALTMETGARVFGSARASTLDIEGSLLVNNYGYSEPNFTDVHIRPVSTAGSRYTIGINGSNILRGSVHADEGEVPAVGNFSASRSTFDSLTRPMVIGRTSGKHSLTVNTFRNMSPLVIWAGTASTLLQFNNFEGGEVVVHASADPLRLSFNNFFDTRLRLESASSSALVDLDIPNNYWYVNQPATGPLRSIDDLISDQADGRPVGTVRYLPILTDPARPSTRGLPCTAIIDCFVLGS